MVPCPNSKAPFDHDFLLNFGISSLAHHYYILSLSELRLAVKTNIFKKIMHIHLVIYMATPWYKNP